jgi:hypothetical protein
MGGPSPKLARAIAGSAAAVLIGAQCTPHQTLDSVADLRNERVAGST